MVYPCWNLWLINGKFRKRPVSNEAECGERSGPSQIQLFELGQWPKGFGGGGAGGYALPWYGTVL